MNNKDKMNPLIFLFFIYFLGILLFILPAKDYSENEKRILATKPEFSVKGILSGQFQKELEKYYEDHLPGRELFVALDSYLKLAEGRNIQQDFYHAKEDYLIRRLEENKKERFEKTLGIFDSFAEECGLPVELIMIPASGYINEEKLPMGHAEYPDDMLFEYAEKTLEHMDLLDVRQLLKEKNVERPVFYRTDHHMTSYGNYQVYRYWKTQKKENCLDEQAYKEERIPGFYGTAWSGSGYRLIPSENLEIWHSGTDFQVTITDGGKEDIIAKSLFFREHLQEGDKYPVFLDGNHTIVSIENTENIKKNKGENILVIKDSFANCFAGFMAEDCRNLYLMDLRFFRGSAKEFIKEHEIDRVLFFYGTQTLLTDSNAPWLVNGGER